MQKILEDKKISRIHKINMYMTMSRKTMAVGTIMLMLHGEDTWNIFKKKMKNILILWQAQPCRSWF
eukprot:12899991-Prorocentrum_lima.AAC.1